MKFEAPHCDGGIWGPDTVICSIPATHQCICKRCQSEEPAERFYTCKAHLGDVAEKHERVRGKPASWTVAPDNSRITDG
jgi:hypothetical protein